MRTEAKSPRYQGLDAWPPREILEALLERQFLALAAVKGVLPVIEEAAIEASRRLARGGRLAYAGAGTSGRLAVLDAVELPPTFGWPEARLLLFLAGGEAAMTRAVEAAEDDRAAGEEAAKKLGEEDVLIAVSASGRTPYTVALARAAQKRGALTLGIANNAESPLLKAVDYPLFLDTGPEVIAGSTRLAAGTAQKATLNLFSTLVMTRLGRVYDNLMVGMRPTNEKLEQRAIKIVAEAAGVSLEAAKAALKAAENEIPLAILIALGHEKEAAKARLQAAGGRLREALE